MNNNKLLQRKIYNKETIESIRNECDNVKVDFIKFSLAQTGIPDNYTAIPYSKPEKIFYHTIDGKQIRREWLGFHDNKFFCVYCLMPMLLII